MEVNVAVNLSACRVGPSNEQQHSFITSRTTTYKQHHNWNHTTKSLL